MESLINLSEEEYMWKAEFKNGEIMLQKESDNYRSFVNEILPRSEELQFFSLIGDKHNILVDMTDGAFQIDGLWIGKQNLRFSRYVEEEFPIANNTYKSPDNSIVYGVKLKPIFGRRTSKLFNADLTQVGAYYVYYIGWEANVITSEIAYTKCLDCDMVFNKSQEQEHAEEFTHLNWIDYQYGEIVKTTKHIAYVHPDGLIVFA